MSFPAVRLRLALLLPGLILAVESCSPPPKPESRKNIAGSEEPDSPPENTTPDKIPATGSAPSAEVALGNKVNSADKEALTAFGEAYARAMTAGDDAAARAAWNADALFFLALGAGAKAAPEAAGEMRKDFLSSIGKKPGGVMWATFGEPWRLLRIRETDGETRALFRVAVDGTLTYFELIPRFDAAGDLKFVDAHAFANGERFSKTFGRVSLPQLAEASGKPIDALLESPDPLIDHVDQFKEFSKSIEAENYKAALDHYRAMPPEIQKNKTVLLMYLGAIGKLMQAGANPEIENAHREGIKQFEKLHGDDPAFLLLGIDYHFSRQDFNAAAEAIDKLDKAVDGDPYLDFFRASVLLSQDKLKEALPLAEKARENDPDLEDPYWGIVNIQLALGNFEAVAVGLDQLASKFDYEFELGEDPAYEAFLESPAGKAWIEKQKTAPGGN